MSLRNLMSFVLAVSQGALVISKPTCRSAPTPTNNTACLDATFLFPIDQLFGTSPLSITASPVHNFSTVSLAPGTSTGGMVTINYCNVTVTYTHPGWNDTIHVTVGLPTHDSWNGRLQALGGGGYSASFGTLYTAQAIDKGYAAVDTDAGHVKGSDVSQSPSSWALRSPGNVNLNLAEDWGSRSLHEMAVIGKAMASAYYGTGPQYSYFSGCSGGGRQGLMIAQRFADDFDGIMAAAPAMHIHNFIPAGFWATHMMNKLGVYPPPCEIEAFTQAAIDDCDELDGLKDGIISLPELCDFDPRSVVGQSFNCSGTTRQFTSDGASVVDAAWTGPRGKSGTVGWFGINKDASLTSYYISTQCNANNTNCSGGPGGLLFSSWITYFVAKDQDFNLTTMTDDQFFSFLSQTQQEYESMMGADDPDLTDFRNAGGKMIMWQGLADEAIPNNGTLAYYQQVLDHFTDAQSFMRHYTAPGVGHCIGGTGAIPNGAFDQLVAWVENGTVPDTLAAVDATGSHVRNLCAYPLQQVYLGGNATDPASFDCQLDPGASQSIAAEFPFYR